MTLPATPSAITSYGALMAIGGAEDKMKARRILKAFLDLDLPARLPLYRLVGGLFIKALYPHYLQAIQ